MQTNQYTCTNKMSHRNYFITTDCQRVGELTQVQFKLEIISIWKKNHLGFQFSVFVMNSHLIF